MSAMGHPVRFEDDVLFTDEEKGYSIVRLVERFVEEPSSWFPENVTNKILDIFSQAQAELPADEKVQFTRRWTEETKRLWPRAGRQCFECWKSALEHHQRRKNMWALDFLRALPPAAETDEWFAWSLDEFLKLVALPDGFLGQPQDWVECLQEFRCWTGPTARRFLYALDQPKDPLKLDRVSGLVSPVRELSSRDRTCIALTFLTRERARFAELGNKLERSQIAHFEDQKRQIAGLPEGALLLRVFGRIEDLPSPHYNDRSVWREFGPDEKAAWGTEIVTMVGDQAPIRQGLIEYLLWQTREDRYAAGLYSEMELLALSICRTEEDARFLCQLRDEHVSRLVNVRAAALLARLGRAPGPSPFVPLPQDGITAAAASQALAIGAGHELRARTWMQDPALDRIVFGAVARIEAEFSDGYQHDWRLDEEVHLATLLTRLQVGFKVANGLFRALSSPHGRGAPRIEFSYRQISKREEGGRGIRVATFSTDVAFITSVTDAGHEVSKRAILIQCKKLPMNDKGSWRPGFDIDRRQCDDLITQTEASYYMFLVPPFMGSEIWMAPARLVRNLVNLHDAKRKTRSLRGTLPCASAYYCSRSLAHWIAYDLFGLWTGDERRALTDKVARPDPGYSPRFVASLTIKLNPTSGLQ
jgi:hypothetical protein